MDTIIANYINGNLADAKRGAKRFSLQKLVDGLKEHGFGLHAACDVANFLKGYGSFQAACDSELADKH